MGKRANNCTANRTREKTAKSSGSREAKTTEEEIAAFMERTDVNLRGRDENGQKGEHSIVPVLSHLPCDCGTGFRVL